LVVSHGDTGGRGRPRWQTRPTVWVYLVGQILSGFFAGIAFLTFGWWAY
jgi:hypothetical protein